jgi:hypothetical protein
MGAVGSSGGNQALLFALPDSAARQIANQGGSVHWSFHDPDRNRWLEVGRFPRKDVASMSMHALVAHDHGRRKGFRIKKVTIPPQA